jgi:hypothetical protein
MKIMNSQLESQNSALQAMNSHLSQINSSIQRREDRFISVMEGMTSVLERLAPARPPPSIPPEHAVSTAPLNPLNDTCSNLPVVLAPSIDSNKLQVDFEQEWAKEKENTRRAVQGRRHEFPLADSPMDRYGYEPRHYARRPRGNIRARGGNKGLKV